MKRYFLLPFHQTPLLLVAIFTLGLSLAVRAGFFGLPLTLLLLSWFTKYCFIVLDAVMRGDEHLPVLSVEMVNPVDEQRPLALLLLLIAAGMGVFALRSHGGYAIAGLAVGVIVLALPACIALLGLTRNVFQAVNPLALWALIRGLGSSYALLNVALLGVAVVVYLAASQSVPLWVGTAVGQLVLLLAFTLIGGTLFEHRHELGLDSRTAVQHRAERDAREHDLERRRMLDRAYASFRVHEPLRGWQQINTWIATHARDDGTAERELVLTAVMCWDDPRPADRMANDLIDLFMARRANSDALRIVEARLATHPGFQIASRSHAVRLAELAGLAGKRALQRRLTTTNTASH